MKTMKPLVYTGFTNICVYADGSYISPAVGDSDGAIAVWTVEGYVFSEDERPRLPFDAPYIDADNVYLI